MTDKHWHCEHCNEEHTDEPALTETVPGVGGPIDLWYCADCTRGKQ